MKKAYFGQVYVQCCQGLIFDGLGRTTWVCNDRRFNFELQIHCFSFIYRKDNFKNLPKLVFPNKISHKKKSFRIVILEHVFRMKFLKHIWKMYFRIYFSKINFKIYFSEYFVYPKIHKRIIVIFKNEWGARSN